VTLVLCDYLIVILRCMNVIFSVLDVGLCVVDVTLCLLNLGIGVFYILVSCVGVSLRLCLLCVSLIGSLLGFANGLVGRLEVTLCLLDRKSTRLNSSHVSISYAVFSSKKKNRKSSSTFL